MNQIDLEDGLLRHLAAQPNAVAAFPFLGQLKNAAAPAQRPGGCAPCQQNNRQRVQTFNAVKAAVAGLDPESRRRFKELVGAGQLRVRWLDGGQARETVL